MKVRLIIENDEVIIITEDGGIACIREAEPLEGICDNRIATTDYYQNRLHAEPMTQDNVFEVLAEGKMYYNDWDKHPYNSWVNILDAIQWLVSSTEPEDIVFDNTLFKDLFPEGE